LEGVVHGDDSPHPDEIIGVTMTAPAFRDFSAHCAVSGEISKYALSHSYLTDRMGSMTLYEVLNPAE